MVKYDLRRQGFSVTERKQNHDIITALWVIFTIILVVGNILPVAVFFNSIMGYDAATLADMRAEYWFSLWVDSSPWNIMIIIIGSYFAYLALKLIMTIFVCNDKFRSIKLKLLAINAVPICQCKEALTVRQTVFIYFVPFIIMYFAMYALCLLSLASLFVFLAMFIMSFFLAFDLTLVVYVLYISVKYKIDYVAVDHHIYELTTYKNTYIGRNGKAVKSEIKTLNNKYKKRMYEHITTCLNMACENYTVNFDESTKICPACGDKIYKAAVLSNVVTCVNPACGNYGHELKLDMQKCSLCGTKTGRLAFKFNDDLKKPAIVLSVTAAVVFCLIHLIMVLNGANYVSYIFGRGILSDLLNLIEVVTFGIAVIMGFLSKDKKAFIIAAASVLFTVGFAFIIA